MYRFLNRLILGGLGCAFGSLFFLILAGMVFIDELFSEVPSCYLSRREMIWDDLSDNLTDAARYAGAIFSFSYRDRVVNDMDCAAI